MEGDARTAVAEMFSQKVKALWPSRSCCEESVFLRFLCLYAAIPSSNESAPEFQRRDASFRELDRSVPLSLMRFFLGESRGVEP
jgi:hypothetical protein